MSALQHQGSFIMHHLSEFRTVYAGRISRVLFPGKLGAGEGAAEGSGCRMVCTQAACTYLEGVKRLEGHGALVGSQVAQHGLTGPHVL